jgi:DNA-binding transcriptional MerR regulator
MKVCTLGCMTDGGDQIGVVAERHQVTPATLRYYEEMGLLPAPDRTASGYRIYDDGHDQRLRFIGRAKQLDLSLEEIKVLLDVWDRGGCHDTREQLRHAVAHKVLEARRRATEALVFAEQLTHVYEQLSTSADVCGARDETCRCVPELPASPDADFEAELRHISDGSCGCHGALRPSRDDIGFVGSDGCACCSESPSTM